MGKVEVSPLDCGNDEDWGRSPGEAKLTEGDKEQRVSPVISVASVALYCGCDCDGHRQSRGLSASCRSCRPRSFQGGLDP